ncbi:unnamed protein product [Orchesella dallaii]|uniref:Caspase-8 n=1 Tax=Orchesella dallaii TaxID=48710 RepID=A0ABP1RI67_9HEXA
MALIKALERTQQIEAVMILKQIYDSSPSGSQSTPQSSSSTGLQEIEARTLIERNYAALVRLIDCNLSLVTRLMSRNELSNEDLAVIMSREFPFQRAESLLNIIQTRVGGYVALIKALEDTNQSTTTAFDILSGKLDTGPSKEASSSSEPTAFEEGPGRFAELINKITEYEHKYNRNMLQRELPKELFDWVAIGAKLNVKVRNPNDDEKIRLKKSQYTTRKAYALILNIIKFPDQKDFREGAQLDTTYMVELWKGLGFKIFPEDETFRNSDHKSKDDIIKQLQIFRTKCVEDEVDCYVIFIGSHGFNDVIFTSEGNTLDFYTDIIYPMQFSASNPRKRVAKIFINQSCQSNPPANYSHTQPLRQPDVQDTFYVKAQIPKYEANRDKKVGSYFVIVLTCVFMRYAYEKSLVDMITEVQRLLKIVSRQAGDECRQLCPLFQMDFLSPFYFFN